MGCVFQSLAHSFPVSLSQLETLTGDGGWEEEAPVFLPLCLGLHVWHWKPSPRFPDPSEQICPVTDIPGSFSLPLLPTSLGILLFLLAS
jgi:hypothetical protein